MSRGRGNSGEGGAAAGADVGGRAGAVLVGLSVRPATEADFVLLAGPLAAQPLLQAYGIDPEVLCGRWRAAQAAGDGLLVACASQPSKDESAVLGLMWCMAGAGFAHGTYLRYLAVLDGAQGRGVGLALLRAFEAWGTSSPPAGGWFLLCSDFNTRAQSFYRRQGYRHIGSLPNFVRSGIVEEIFWQPPFAGI